MNADPTTLCKSHALFRKAVMSVFTHNLPDPAPFRQASRDLENAFHTALELVPNHIFFPVHMFRVLVRLRRTIRRWTAMIPRVLQIQPIPGMSRRNEMKADIIHCPNPWAKKCKPGTAEQQLGKSTSAPQQNAPQSPATHHTAPTTHHASQSDAMSIPQALQHERRQAWKLRIDLPHIHPINPLAPNRPKRQGDSAHLTNTPRHRPWSGWKALPGPQPKPYNPATEQTEDLSHPFHQALCDTGTPEKTQPGNTEHQLGNSPTPSIPSIPSIPSFSKFTSTTHHPSRTTHHEPRSGSLLDSPLSYQRHLDHVLLQIVTTLVRAYAKTRRLADRTNDWTPMPQFESISNLPTEEQVDPYKNHPSYLNSQTFFTTLGDTLEQLLRRRLEAIWFHAHHPLDGPPIEPNPKHLARWTGQKLETTTSPIPNQPHPPP